jgi:hypothetical protein
VIALLTLFWYGLVPVGGAFISRRFWRSFRKRFDDLCLTPLLDYARYSRGRGGTCRFTGGFESVTDGQTLWVRGAALTVPVILKGAHTYVLPMSEKDEPFDPRREAPERIRWNRVSTLTTGARVFVGGSLVSLEDRQSFVSTREHPLLVIFYDGNDSSLSARIIRAGRHRNEYWNPLTPYALLLGAFTNIVLAVSFLSRPALRLNALAALIAFFVPLLPLAPPGVLLTALYRRLWLQARICRARRDLARLPLKYLAAGGRLPDGEPYGCLRRKTPPEPSIPRLLPGEFPRQGEEWHIFGVLPGGKTPESGIPREPADVFAAYGALPGDPERLARRYTRRAYVLEIVGWLILLAGLTLNVLFVVLLLQKSGLIPAHGPGSRFV